VRIRLENIRYVCNNRATAVCPQCVDIPAVAVTHTLCVLLHSSADIYCNELGCWRSHEILHWYYVHGTWNV